MRALTSECNIIFFLFRKYMQHSEAGGKRKRARKACLCAPRPDKRSCLEGDRCGLHPQLHAGGRGAEHQAAHTAACQGDWSHNSAAGLRADSLALDNIEKLRAACNPDLIELVPGLMPKIIRQVHSLHRTPLIAGRTHTGQGGYDECALSGGDQHLHLVRGGMAGALTPVRRQVRSNF